MKYEQYKKLTKSQKEEYDYRFRDYEYLNIRFTDFIVFVCLGITAMAMVVGVYDRGVISLEQMQHLVNSATSFFKFGLYYLLIISLLNVIGIFIHAYEERKFMKRVGLK